MTALASLRCAPMTGAAMSADEVARHLGLVEGWQMIDGALEKTFRFPDYHHTMAFVNAVAWIAHRQDHHPDLSVSYAKCVVRFETHSVNGLSLNDFICAAQADALLA